jgi:glycosyltransferase involved in cell wall biosynthesis
MSRAIGPVEFANLQTHPNRAGTAPTPQLISVNGKFLLAPTEGMPRVAVQVILAMDRLLAAEPNLSCRYDIELLHPNGATPPALQFIRSRVVGQLQGQLWEQIDFPKASRGRIGLNFTSTGPIAKRRCLTVIHDAQMFLTPQSMMPKHRLLYSTVTPTVGHLHTSIVTVSEYSKLQLARFLMTRGPVRVIHNAGDHIATINSDPAILARLGLQGRRYVLSNAYPHAHKNVPILLAAFEHLADLDARLVLFGRGQRTDFEALGHRVPASVQFTGRVSDGALRALMEGAQAFAFPSTTEGFGIPPLEAMTLGCPTLVSNAGAMPEVCADGALYAEPRDATAWAAALRALLTDADLRARTSAAGRQRAATFSWDRTARAYLDELGKL